MYKQKENKRVEYTLGERIGERIEYTFLLLTYAVKIHHFIYSVDVVSLTHR